MKVIAAFVLLANLCLALGDCPSGLCSQDETCCNGPSPGTYGCCPDPKAVCCSDGLHCCPQNTVCNLAQGTCDSSVAGLVPFVFRQKEDVQKINLKATEMKTADKVDVIYCPGGVYYCPDGNTCCLLATGQYGCCPYPNAMCCNDKVHCCPYGTRCDSTSQYCLQGHLKFPVAFKKPALVRK